jgi:hypothetical protein
MLISIYIIFPGLKLGQSIIIQPLDNHDLMTEYRSDSSLSFQPYIVDPTMTTDMVERALYKRYGCHITLYQISPKTSF